MVTAMLAFLENDCSAVVVLEIDNLCGSILECSIG